MRKRKKNGITCFLCLLVLSLFCSYCCHAAITASSPLSMGQTLSSPRGIYELGFFSPNNSRNQYAGIWYKNFTPLIVLWVANRDKPVTDSVANLTISSNGSLILLDGKQDVLWSSNENPVSNRSRAELLENGNLVLTDIISGRLLWQSFDHPGNVLLPYSRLTYDLKIGEKRVLTSWKSTTDPSLGDFVAEIRPQVPLQLFIMRGSIPHWRTGPWARTRFAGVPGMDESYASPLSVVQDVENGTGYYSYSLRGDLDLSYIIVTSQGTLRTLFYKGTKWHVNFETSLSLCDLYGACGPFGLCLSSNPVSCICLKGFVPKSDKEWENGNWTGGCVRRTELSCQKNSTATTQGKESDGFYRIAKIKPPDFYEYIRYVRVEECSQRCLQNCSCTAFAYITGIGCLVYKSELIDTVELSSGGEFLSIRLAHSELGGNNRTKTIAASTVSISIFVVIVFAAYGFWRYRMKQNDTRHRSKDTSRDAWNNGLNPQDVSDLHFFDIDTIRTATNNFNMSNKLGQGGFGPVYKGKLQDGKEIAVKRLSSNSGQGAEEFMNEIILISKLQHRNLVRLLGCCIEREEKLLVYEFMVNKSLDMFLFDSTKKLEIDWPKRFDIIQGIARGLLYLHRDSCLRVVHRDLKVSNILLDENMKPKISDFGLARMFQGTQDQANTRKVVHRDLKVSNILLDENMKPKISDFGLARMFQGTQDQANTRKVVGTLGYMSPEYALTGMVYEKSDICSFGVLVLEIVSGKKISSYDVDDKTLFAYAWESWCENGGLDLLDQGRAISYSPFEVTRCVQIALLCVQTQAMDRPNISKVVSMFSSTTNLPMPKKPIFALQNILHTRDRGSQAENLFSVNEITHTVMQCR